MGWEETRDARITKELWEKEGVTDDWFLGWVAVCGTLASDGGRCVKVICTKFDFGGVWFFCGNWNWPGYGWTCPLRDQKEGLGSEMCDENGVGR